ncbi:hypothetical protein BHE74_00050714 [Ensete ventricosum]|nr:hypothetical protein BHE74_00050714 [Ensete ventricosum]
MSIADQLTGVVGHHHPHAGVERVDDFLAMSPVRMEGKGRLLRKQNDSAVVDEQSAGPLLMRQRCHERRAQSTQTSIILSDR